MRALIAAAPGGGIAAELPSRPCVDRALARDFARTPQGLTAFLCTKETEGSLKYAACRIPAANYTSGAAIFYTQCFVLNHKRHCLLMAGVA